MEQNAENKDQVNYLMNKQKKCAHQKEVLQGRLVQFEQEVRMKDDNFLVFSNQSHHEIADLKTDKMKLNEALSFCEYSKVTMTSQLKLVRSKLNDTQSELDDKQLDLHKCNRDYDTTTAGLTEKVRELVEKYHFIRGELTDCSQRQDKTQTLKCNFLEVCEKRLKKCERSVEQQIQQVDSCRHRLIENHNNRLHEAERLSSEDENKLNQEITSSESNEGEYDNISYVDEEKR